MADLETFTQYPLQIDPQTKAISTTTTTSQPSTSSDRALAAELTQLNLLHRSLLALEAPLPVPPPPYPVNPKRSGNITRLRDSGNTEYRKGKFTEAIRYYTLGLQMALTRPAWEPQALMREETASLLANRAQAHMALQNWAEGAVDAEASVEAKRGGNAKAWWRRGRCLLEMGRLEEAKEWVGKGLEMEGQEAELVALLKEVEGKMGKTVPEAA